MILTFELKLVGVSKAVLFWGKHGAFSAHKERNSEKWTFWGKYTSSVPIIASGKFCFLCFADTAPISSKSERRFCGHVN